MESNARAGAGLAKGQATMNGAGRFRLARFERWVAGVSAFGVLLTGLGTFGTFLRRRRVLRSSS